MVKKDNRAYTVQKLIAVIYVFVVLVTSLFLQLYASNVPNKLLLGIILLIPCLAISFFLIKFLSKFVNKFSLTQTSNLSLMHKIISFLIFFVLIMLVFTFWFAAFNPGFFAGDILNQFIQLQCNKYNDWHPYLSTYIILSLPLQITNDYHCVTIFQYIEIALVLAFLLETIYEYSNKIFSAISLLFIVLNPNIACMAVHPWKDSIFIVFTCLSLVILARMYFNRKKSKSNFVLLIVLFVTLFFVINIRHNGILFALPVCLLVFFLCKKKQVIICLVSLIVLCCFWKFAALRMLNVEEAQNRTVEVSGLSMNVITNVMAKTPENIDEDTKNYIYRFASQETWDQSLVVYSDLENHDAIGKWFQIKYKPEVDLAQVDEQGPLKLAQTAAICLFESPKEAIASLLYETGLVYAFHYNGDGFTSFSVIDYSPKWDNYCFNFEGNYQLIDIIYSYEKIFQVLFCSLSFITLIIVMSVLLKQNIFKKENIFKVLFALPVLVYAFGTMLLLQTHDFRYFMFMFPLLPLIILVIFRNEDNKIHLSI